MNFRVDQAACVEQLREQRAAGEMIVSSESVARITGQQQSLFFGGAGLSEGTRDDRGLQRGDGRRTIQSSRAFRLRVLDLDVA